MKVTMLESAALGLLPVSGWILAWFSYSLTLKMEATCFSETSVDFWRATRRYLQEIELSAEIDCDYFVLTDDNYFISHGALGHKVVPVLN
jgi:hypothetical protein